MAKIEVERLLFQLGISSNYYGYKQLAAALDKILDDLDRLSHINRLFQEISEELNTSPTAIRDNIDTLIEASWRKNPDLIRSISNYPLPARPSVKRFREIACNYLMRARGIIV